MGWGEGAPGPGADCVGACAAIGAGQPRVVPSHVSGSVSGGNKMVLPQTPGSLCQSRHHPVPNVYVSGEEGVNEAPGSVCKEPGQGAVAARGDSITIGAVTQAGKTYPTPSPGLQWSA